MFFCDWLWMSHWYVFISGTNQGLLMTANEYQTNGVPSTLPVQNGGLHQGYTPQLSPGVQLSVNTVDAVTESIKSDRSIRLWKMEALKVMSAMIQLVHYFCWAHLQWASHSCHNVTLAYVCASICPDLSRTSWFIYGFQNNCFSKVSFR